MKINFEEIISHIKTDENFDWYTAETQDQPSVSSRYQQFFSLINQHSPITKRDTSISMIEQWLVENHNQSWFQALQNQWHKVESIADSFTLDSLFQPLINVMDQVSLQLQPAPAYRGSAVTTSPVMTPKPRRRAIEAADLPIFTTLFCTAIELNHNPIKLKGLQPNHQYQLTLRCNQLPDWQSQTEVIANESGGINLNIADQIQSLKDQHVNDFELIWLLEDISSSNNQWTSGLIWYSHKIENSHQEDFRKILLDSTQEDIQDNQLQNLIEINLLIRWQQYTQAYELARKHLLNIATTDLSSPLPYREGLWHFVLLILDEMIDKMSTLETHFKSLKPEWNAVNALKDLQNNITEWD